MATANQPQTATLAQLIETHKDAVTDFEDACYKLERVEMVYDHKPGKDLKVNIAGIMAHVVIGDEEQMRGFVEMALDDCRKPVGRLLKSVSSDFGVAFEQFLEASKAELYAKIDAALADEAHNQELFGLTAARNNWEAKNAAEKEALTAICAYRCATHDEERKRLRYILQCQSAMAYSDSFNDFATELLQSMSAVEPMSASDAA